jgi:hypothetical protein
LKQNLFGILARTKSGLEVTRRRTDAGLLNGPVQAAAQEIFAPALQVAQKQSFG